MITFLVVRQLGRLQQLRLDVQRLIGRPGVAAAFDAAAALARVLCIVRESLLAYLRMGICAARNLGRYPDVSVRLRKPVALPLPPSTGICTIR